MIGQPEIGQKTTYEIVSIEETKRKTGFLLSVKKPGGRTEFSRVFVANGDIDAYKVGGTLDLVPWSMEMVPVKYDRDGELRTIRNVSGLSWDTSEVERDARRSAQNMYDNAVQVGCNTTTVAAAVRGNYFIDFVDKDTFLEMVKQGGV